jgi:hypothetical protein
MVKWSQMVKSLERYDCDLDKMEIPVSEADKYRISCNDPSKLPSAT